MKVIGVAGFKNAGKTTLVEKLVRHLSGLGYRVSTVKHAHHSFDIDQEGRDSFRHRKAGAMEVAVISKERTAIMHELRGDQPPSLADVLHRLQPCDLVIVEGYKRDSHDKIEVRNVELDHPELARDDPTVVAVAANGPTRASVVPVFDRDDVVALTAFIIHHCKLNLARPQIRRAGKADAAAVQHLTRAVYRKWIAVIGREPLPMQAHYETAVELHWIDLLEQDGNLIALVEMIPRSDHLHVENIAVAEAHQGQGVARLLLHHAAQLARKSELPELRLLTNKAFASNLMVYEKLGFENYKETAFPGGGTIVHFRKSVS